ncbi:benzoate 1,2-dioxygenase electron transfer component BenC [Klebsiella quasipneumoniae]|uniref:benzoate 1,2-dioxygenase electron transfer component BenC n=1 Tax=Klebsiella quasipneumoniae TaxID=1463165 RepID=UPI000E2D681E|nr:benzoate 1,2-dioxygenase electron transfer component BenC [Klebsiella quasipneumoniae]SXD04629.1 benzoate dioxygenase, ferredoxin reductase component [Klebsiella quasipneumoniae]
MTFTIALNFEDGITRFIQCHAGEKVLDAAYRQKVNLPMDCSDGVCGTCKCHCASGEYALGDEYLDEALSDEEAQARQVLTCQMVPTSDCVIDVPVAAAQCKTALTNTGAQVRQVNCLSDTAVELVVALDEPLDFLAGQYVNIQVPGTPHVRAYSFSSRPGSAEGRFLIRNVPGGMMSQWLTRQARPGDRLILSGPKGSFYLRHGERPLLMLAGGTGLAPLLSMLETLQAQNSSRPVTLLYGVTRDGDLVKTEALEAFRQQLTHFRWLPVVAEENSACPQRGFVTDHLDDAMLNNGEVDIYLCGPPPMVNAVATALRERGIAPAGFWYEKFIASQSAAA